ncbi:MAG: hypothetical protein JWM16_2614 [Verrucomicrobiales bacterium]|jgi:ElaB/YqjD/DUF883 family membrane-anchored ribosome-binding protein|nr:hypothetical protein [Verrucomicrobiales bacterium]
MERYEQQNAGQDLGAAARTGAEAAKGGMNDLAEKGQEAASKLSSALNTAKTRIQESTTAGARATDRVIRDHPYESIGIAFGVGVLIGVLINRK